MRLAFALAIGVLCFVTSLEAEDYTQLGGKMTSYLPGPAALQVFAPNVVSKANQDLQLSGFAPFHHIMSREEGLGPRFVNSSCGGCHIENGRGPLRFDRARALKGGAMVIKVTGDKKLTAPVLQNHSVDGATFHGIRLRWRRIKGSYPDGTPFSLRAPQLTFKVKNATHRKIKHSLRMTPPIIGVGLLEAISLSDVLAKEDISDSDNDGISGRANLVKDIRAVSISLGRFGYKASQPTVEQQSAAALGNEMGISNSLFPVSEPLEFSDDHLHRVTVYQKLGGVPAARNQSDPVVALGKKIFFEVGCEGCHTATFVTSSNPLEELSNQTIHPFTDLLLHDMGPGLADKHPEGMAGGREWRTTPLWGLGFSRQLSDITPFYLHDGRARTVEEAILWHGGEGLKSRKLFMNRSKDERHALIAFLLAL
ncbi:MAG: thiol oxidoreductase [Deltaproteobacteria bacterium]|nr:thiol oxidoreductase [Deltaproteobacteria bacterium]